MLLKGVCGHSALFGFSALHVVTVPQWWMESFSVYTFYQLLSGVLKSPAVIVDLLPFPVLSALGSYTVKLQY